MADEKADELPKRTTEQEFVEAVKRERLAVTLVQQLRAAGFECELGYKFRSPH